MRVGVLPRGTVAVGTRVGCCVGAVAKGTAKFWNAVNPTETKINKATPIERIATASGMRVLPMRRARLGGSCERFNGAVGSGGTASSSGATS